ncbi:protein kinase domain-containing protein [Streptomyces sp. WI04-05B]|uniref:protein kinase domain-containing protein n=1 Tax=Streptomyces TaxID=1883 RepID=UPI0029A583CE|nr:MULTISPECIES: PQQ-binding-like beta-propeller repeat protein [unclassified Streptomyces]MDX2540595.1 PQQ-binding-like beta-propeller repeat protein [Streptomyces sp. WI04-05B]MDX2584973.1 PQQ-binding-like beta-propeller repeat protein [Streptomyces sp. WI04-05A]MDX3749241.1 PQQ-binding-like beta-propeller repeat protein [Streptomyces sp. AK08-02]
MEPLRPTDPERLGPYRPVARLGAGGMGEVFLAKDDRQQTVAVKVIRPELASGKAFRDRFRREVDAARAVSGTYTASVVDADPDGPVPWLATTHIVGPTLAEAVEAYGPLPPSTALALGAGLAEALIAVHSAGLVHRDLKPSNVLLSAEGPRVIDFGIVRATDGYELTLSGVLLGSPRYMCPEHATGDPMGPAGDVFCLGSVLAYAATGKAPFDGASAATLLYQVVHGTPDLTGVKDPLETIIRLCLEKPPAARPSPDRVSAACAPGGADALDWNGWLPETVTSAIRRQAAVLMDLDLGLGLDPRVDVVGRQPAHATVTAAASAPTSTSAPGGLRVDPRLAAVRRLVADGGISGSQRVVFPGEPKPAPPQEQPPAQPPAQSPERGTHRARRSPRPHLSRRRVLGVAALALGTGVTALLHGSRDRSGSVATPAGPAPEPLWTYRSEPLVQAPAVFYNETALLKTQSGSLFCLGLTDGASPRWTYRGISQSPTPPLVLGDVVVALGTGATVIGVDPVTGAERYSLDFGTDFRFDTLLGGAVGTATIVGLRFDRQDRPDGSRGPATSTNVVLGTDLKERLAQVIPISKEDIGLDLKPFIDADRFVYVDGLHRLTARGGDARGSVLWSRPMASGSETRSAPVVLDNTVFAADSELVAVDLVSGALRWRARQENGGFASVAAAGDTVYCTTRSPHGVAAFDAADGSRRWFCETPQLNLENPLVAGGDAVFVTADANKDGFYAIDARRGELLWNFTDGRDTGINNWQLSCGTDAGTDHPLIAQHYDKVYALPMPRS